MADERLRLATLRACDEISIVFSGLDGVLELIAAGNSKQVRMNRNSLYFAIEPHVKRMKTALDDLNAVRKAVRDGTT